MAQQMGGGSAYAIPNVMVSTTGEIPGHTINRYLGVVFGITVRSRGVQEANVLEAVKSAWAVK